MKSHWNQCSGRGALGRLLPPKIETKPCPLNGLRSILSPTMFLDLPAALLCIGLGSVACQAWKFDTDEVEAEAGSRQAARRLFDKEMCVLVFSLTSDTFTSYYTYYGSLSNCSAKELRMLRYMYVSFYHALFMTNITSSKTCDTRPGLTDWSRPTCTSYALQENRKTCVVLGRWIFFCQSRVYEILE